MSQPYSWFSDSGHAWLQVPLADISSAVAMQVSAYSYVNGSFAYLEEDCDAGVFLAANPAATTRELPQARFDSPVRGYASFLPQAVQA